MKKVIHAVSLGPGNYELMTLKALKILKNADIIIMSGSAGYAGKARAERFLDNIGCGHKLKVFAMPETSDIKAHKKYNMELADIAEDFINRGNKAAYACFGDITVFTSYGNLFKIFKERGITFEAVPGVSSFMAPAAIGGTTLAEWKGGFSVVSMPENAEYLNELAEKFDTVIIMKIQDGGKILKEYITKYKPSIALLILNAYTENQQIANLTDGFPKINNLYMSVTMIKK